MVHRYTSLSTIVLTALLLLSSCTRAFELSPYSGDLSEDYTDLSTANNLARLQATPGQNAPTGGTTKVALLSDTHYWNDELHEMVDRINADPTVTFTIFCGDYSDQGLQQEYLDFYKEVKRLQKPFFTVTGNHDYLAGAQTIYRKMFGPENYAFVYEGYQFIFFDDVFWEKNGSPDYDWLEAQLAQKGATPLVFAHLPPFSDQFTPADAARYEGLMKQYGVPASIHGHNHQYTLVDGPANNAATTYLVVPSAEKEEFCTLTLKPGSRPVIDRVHMK